MSRESPTAILSRLSHRHCGVFRIEDANAAGVTANQIHGLRRSGVVERVLPIYIDPVVMEKEWVIVGGGDRSSKLKLAPSELAALPGAQVVAGLSLSPA